jgi:multiple sugar transport system ATP-binding protein
MASISFMKAQCWYAGAEAPAVLGIDLEVEDGEFMVLVGPSGCGKSTTLRMLAGLEDVGSGQIHIGGRDVTHVAAKNRDIAMVFQNYALYPHMSVAQNMAFALKMARVPKTEQSKRVTDAARMLGLDEYLERKPKALSGGQRQRVAMGRAIVRKPQVFLMDEPLSNLDAKMRVQTRTDIATLQRDLGVTTLYVTHDQVEAMTMGDRVAVMNAGELQQVDTPLNLYDKPRNLFVAGFIGSPQMNLLRGVAGTGEIKLGSYSVPVERGVSRHENANVIVGVRPEDLRIIRNDEEGLSLEVQVVEELGADGFAYCTHEPGAANKVVVRVNGREAPLKGQTLRVAIDPARAHFFDADTGWRLYD